ncbi:MAG TPA: hypothetical protein VN849_03230 [Stellaceae bacterium]|nr:hypothetical protein [Stellaceae bacterium]
MNDGASDAAHIPKDVDVLEAKEVWSEYRLSDGTILRLKPIMIAVSRLEGEHTLDGDPVYNMKSTLVTDLRVPQELKKSA